MAEVINTFLDNEILTDQNSLTHLLDFDEESDNSINSIEPSLYYTMTNFINKIDTDTCTIMSLNCQSLNAKFSNIKLMLDVFAEFNKPIQVLCLQETWFENSDLIDMGQFHIDDYHLITKNRYACNHGGLAFYIHKNWTFKIKDDIIDSPYLEEMYIDITDPLDPLKAKFTIGNIYRPPHSTIGHLTSFIDYFSRTLTLLSTRANTFVCGDYNINLLTLHSNEHTSNYFDGILSSGFLPAITLPTRISNTSSLIDNIFVSKQGNINCAAILENEISDHQVIAINTNLAIPKPKTRYITIYPNREECKEKFRNDIASKRIYDKLDKDLYADPNTNYKILESEIIKSMNCHMMKKVVKFNKKKHKRDPWITFAILKSVNNKNRLYKKLKKTNINSENYEIRKHEFNAYKNTLRRLINQAKKLYFSSQFIKQRGNGRKTWQTIDNALHRKPHKSSPDGVLINGDMCSDKKNMANAFNEYFATICTNNNPCNNTVPHTDYLKASIHSTFKFKTINNAVTLQYLSNLKPSNSCGHDDISSAILKSISNEISDCITLIINQSIVTGSFPENLKLAKVVPIFKKDDKSQIKNYRPISVLPVISKIFENVMHTQLIEYFTDNNLLSSQQYGFRSNRSTELAALELMDRNIHHMNENCCPVNIYLDFSKAFDSLNYDILLSKLAYYGIQPNALRLLTSYLQDRCQYVQLDNVKSCEHPTTCGIPQGSVLGPLLFNILINDITEASTKFDFIMYADDTTLASTLENFGTVNDVTNLERELNQKSQKSTHGYSVINLC